MVSSIAVGCIETAVYLRQLLRDAYVNEPKCSSRQINGPKEKELNRCDFKALKDVESLIGPNEQLNLVNKITAPPLLYTLGCHELANHTMNKFYEQFNTTLNVSADDDQLKLEQSKTPRKNKLMMNFIYKHKTDVYNAQKIHNLAEGTVETNNDMILKRAGLNASDAISEIKHIHKHNIDNNILDFFSMQLKCSIVMPLGASLHPISKLDCLQVCLDEDSCQSAGYTNDNSSECHLNTEVGNDVGPSFFTCRDNESTRWDYFEKKRQINYFMISSKLKGEVLQATSSSTVALKHYNGDDDQFWFWRGDSIVSKEFPDRVLTMGHGRVFLSRSTDGSKRQMWNFEEGSLMSQHSNLSMSVSMGSSAITTSQYTSSKDQKWSLSLDRYYFIITNRQSGKVLDASPNRPGRVHMWSYHGKDNQLWFWDDDCIRSKIYPSKVLDLHIKDYSRDKWGKVYLHPYNGGDNQRWEMDGNIIISKYKRLHLDVKYSDMTDGALVGGYTHTGNPNQWWMVGTLRTFFFILNKNSGKVIDAHTTKKEIVQWHYHYGKNQLWFWDGNAIRNKEYTDKVLDVGTDAFGKNHGQNLILNSFQDKPSQRWSYRDKYLQCGDFNLNIEVRDGSQTDGAYLAAVENTTQQWSFNAEHDFFIITSRQDASALTAGYKNKDSAYITYVQPYVGADEQQWYFDDDAIRSKAFPERVLDIHVLDYKTDSWGKVYLHPYHGGGNQRWKIGEDQLISHYKDLRLDRKEGGQAGGASKNGKLNQMWSLNSKTKIYYVIQGKASNKVLDVFRNFDVGIWKYHGGDNQLWFWDNDSIRSKKYPDKVLDLHMNNFRENGWGKVYLFTYNGGNNQKWKIDMNNIISEYDNLYLDVKDDSTNSGAPVGGYPSNGNANQQWIITTPNYMKTNCIDETEEKIHNVVQWIPVLSTAWDLYSSIGYAATGCNDVAEKRAAMWAIEATMDVATFLTGGVATEAATVVKVGMREVFEAGIEFGLKHGMKAAVEITQKSITEIVKMSLTNIAEIGIERAWINFAERKLISLTSKDQLAKLIIDPAYFFRNIGKMTKSILSHPLKTVKQTWKAASKKIDDLKKLKKNFDDFKEKRIDFVSERNAYKVRCKRSNLSSCQDKGYSSEQEKVYKTLFDDEILVENVNICAERFMAVNSKYIDDVPQAVKDKLNKFESQTDKAEVFAVYTYTDNSGDVNPIVQNILESKPLLNPGTDKKMLRMYSKEVNSRFYQAALIQNYLKKNSLKQKMTVYRWEQDFMSELYEDNGIYITQRFTSTTEKTGSIKDRGIDLTNSRKYNVELTIHLEKSGANIAEISMYPDRQEWLIPIGTKFKVRKEIDGNGIIKVTLQEIVEKM